MTVEIYPSLMRGQPIERHEWEGTIAGWFASKDLDYLAKDVQPVQVSVNGRLIAVEDWATTDVDADDAVEIRPLPGAAIAPIWWAVIAVAASVAVSLILRPGAPGRQNERQQGRSLDPATAKANLPKLNEIVPELAGRHIRYPDYLTLPRRYFVNYREQWLTFLTCIGPGEYFISPDDVKIGQTRLSEMGDDAAFRIYGPGESVLGDIAHENWYSAPEVGGTSSGTAGLELSSDQESIEHTRASSYSVAGYAVSIPVGSGSFPLSWGPGVQLAILVPMLYSITREGSGSSQHNKFYGFHNHLMPITVGAKVIIAGAGVRGTYQVEDFILDPTGYGWMSFRQQSRRGPDGELVGGGLLSSADLGDRIVTISQEDVFFGVTSATEQEVIVARLSDVGSSDPSWYGFPSISTPEISVQAVGGTGFGEWAGPFAACPSAEATNAIELDLFFPGGLAEIDSKGRLLNRTVVVEFQFREVGSIGQWNSVLRYYNQSTLDQWGATEALVVGNIRPEVRVRRASAESTSTQIQDKVQWYGLKARLPTRFHYPGWTTMAVRIRSGGKLGAQSENQVNVIATRMLPRLTAGGWTAPLPTRDISAFAKYIAGTIGYGDSDLDMAELRRLDALWRARGETFDFVYEQTTTKEALSTCFEAGMAEMTIDHGLIKPMREGLRTQFEQGYSPQNMTGPLTRSFVSKQLDDNDGVEVEYIDGTTWTKETIKCIVPGMPGFKLRKMKLDGVTDRTRAWRIGMREARKLRYRNWSYQFETELDALNSGYMSYVPLIDDIPGYGQSAILEGIEPAAGGALLHVSEPLNWTGSGLHLVGYRRPDGSTAGPYEATRGPDEYSVIANIPQPWPVPTLKMEPPHVYFGPGERFSFPALITEIEPDGIDRVRVSAVNYSDKIYESDNDQP